MAETKKETQKEVKILTLNESIINVRVELQNSKIKKSGKNKYAGFDYYELADFLPKLNELMLKYNINDRFSIEDDYARLELQKGEEINIYKIPFIMFDTPLTYKKNKAGEFLKDKNGDFLQTPSMQDIQYLGALNTYYKRYLYLNAFGITDGEVIDSMDNTDLEKKGKSKSAISKESVKKDVPTYDYKTALINKLKELGIDVNKYAKENNLSSKTTQQQAKELLEKLDSEVLD